MNQLFRLGLALSGDMQRRSAVHVLRVDVCAAIQKDVYDVGISRRMQWSVVLSRFPTIDVRAEAYQGRDDVSSAILRCRMQRGSQRRTDDVHAVTTSQQLLRISRVRRVGAARIHHRHDDRT